MVFICWTGQVGRIARFLRCVLDGSFFELLSGIVSAIFLLLGFCLSRNVAVDTGICLSNLLGVVGSALGLFVQTLNFLLSFLDILLQC